MTEFNQRILYKHYLYLSINGKDDIQKNNHKKYAKEISKSFPPFEVEVKVDDGTPEDWKEDVPEEVVEPKVVDKGDNYNTVESTDKGNKLKEKKLSEKELYDLVKAEQVVILKSYNESVPNLEAERVAKILELYQESDRHKQEETK